MRFRDFYATLTPALPERTPRRVRFTAETQRLRFVLAVLAVGSVLILYAQAATDLHDLAALTSHGRSIDAHITAKSEIHGKSTSYRRDFEFYGGTTSVTGREEISSDDFTLTRIGDPLPVTYLPERPMTFRIGVVTQDRIQKQRIRWLVGGSCLSLVLGLIIVAVEAYYRRRLTLLRDGITVLGRVVDRETVRAKTTAYYIRYEFSIDGSVRTRKISVPFSLYVDASSGTELTILYHLGNPSDNLPARVLTEAEIVD